MGLSDKNQGQEFMSKQDAEKDPTVDLHEHPPIYTGEHFEPEEFEHQEDDY